MDNKENGIGRFKHFELCSAHMRFTRSSSSKAFHHMPCKPDYTRVYKDGFCNRDVNAVALTQKAAFANDVLHVVITSYIQYKYSLYPPEPSSSAVRRVFVFSTVPDFRIRQCNGATTAAFRISRIPDVNLLLQQVITSTIPQAQLHHVFRRIIFHNFLHFGTVVLHIRPLPWKYKEAC